MPDRDPRAHLEATIITLDGGLPTLSPAAARGIIERWLSVLAEYPDYNDVASTLGQLREALTSTPIDGGEVADLLIRLGARTSQAAEGAEDDGSAELVARLGKLLSKGGQALAHSAPLESREEVNASGEPVQQPSTLHGQNPSNPGRKANVGDVRGGASSGTPGLPHNPS
jgi:hypothetical protein